LMFSALIWTTTRLPEPLAAGAEPLGAAAEPLGAAPEAVAEPLGAGGGVTDGAGAYVQPALAVAQPATTTIDRSATDRERAKRIVLGLSRTAGGRSEVAPGPLPRVHTESTALAAVVSRGASGVIEWGLGQVLPLEYHARTGLMGWL
jgi:hypothetical protein